MGTPDGKMQMRDATSTGRTAGVAGGKLNLLKDANFDGTLSCTVKRYNADEGFGFLLSPDVPGDIYFQRKLLPPELSNATAQAIEGRSGSCEVAFTPDGKPQATTMELY